MGIFHGRMEVTCMNLSQASEVFLIENAAKEQAAKKWPYEIPTMSLGPTHVPKSSFGTKEFCNLTEIVVREDDTH